MAYVVIQASAIPRGGSLRDQENLNEQLGAIYMLCPATTKITVILHAMVVSPCDLAWKKPAAGRHQ